MFQLSGFSCRGLGVLGLGVWEQVVVGDRASLKIYLRALCPALPTRGYP